MASRRKADASALAVPAWVPALVREYALALHKGALALGSADGAEIATVVERLAIDERMEGVWRYLLKKRRDGGGFLHAGKPSEALRAMAAEAGVELTPEAMQDDALREVFSAAACAAVMAPLKARSELLAAAKDTSKAHSLVVGAFVHMRRDSPAGTNAHDLMTSIIERLGQIPSALLEAAENGEAPARKRGDMRLRSFVLRMGEEMRTRLSGPGDSADALCGLIAIIANVGLDLRDDGAMSARQVREILRRD